MTTLYRFKIRARIKASERHLSSDQSQYTYEIDTRDTSLTVLSYINWRVYLIALYFHVMMHFILI